MFNSLIQRYIYHRTPETGTELLKRLKLDWGLCHSDQSGIVVVLGCQVPGGWGILYVSVGSIDMCS